MLTKTVWNNLYCDVTALRLPVGGASERVASRSTVGSLRLITLLHGRPVNCTKREAKLCAQLYIIFSLLFFYLCYSTPCISSQLLSAYYLLSVGCITLLHGRPVHCTKREAELCATVQYTHPVRPTHQKAAAVSLLSIICWIWATVQYTYLVRSTVHDADAVSLLSIICWFCSTVHLSNQVN